MSREVRTFKFGHTRIYSYSSNKIIPLIRYRYIETIKCIMNKEYSTYQEETPQRSVVSEPVIVYGVKQEKIEYQEHTSRNDIMRSIDAEELLNRLRPRIKSLFE